MLQLNLSFRSNFLNYNPGQYFLGHSQKLHAKICFLNIFLF